MAYRNCKSVVRSRLISKELLKLIETNKGYVG